MTKYLISGSELYKVVRTLADFIPKTEFFSKIDHVKRKKIFQNPVTSIAYDTFHTSSLGDSFEFDKKDIIKALDFWINDKVLENERLLKLHNKLEDFHETELKNLIEIRESVLKLDNDTKFCRFSDYEHRKNGIKLFETDTVMFYQLVVKKQEEEERPIDEGSIWWRQVPTISDEMSIRFLGGRHSDNRIRDFTIGGVQINNRIRDFTLDGARTRTWTHANSDPNTWRVRPYIYNRINAWMVCDENGTSIATDFRSEGAAQAYIRQHLDNYQAPNTQQRRRMLHNVDLTITQGNPNPYTWHVRPDLENRFEVVDTDNIVIQIGGKTLLDNFDSEINARASIASHRYVYDCMGWGNTDSNGAQINDSPWVGPGIFTVDDTMTNREAIHRLEESVNNVSWNITGSFTTWIEGTSNAFVDLTDSLNQINTNAGISPSRTDNNNGPDHLLHSNLHPGIFTVDDTPRNRELVRRLEYDLSSSTDETNQSIIEFRDMYIDSINLSMGSHDYEMDLNMIGQNGAQISCKISPQYIRESNSLEPTLENGPYVVRILGNNSRRISIDGREYPVLEPVRVTWDRILPPPTTTTGTPISRTEVTENDEFIDYYNMSTMYHSDDIFPSENDYVIYTIAFRNDLVDIEVDLYMTGRDTYHVSSLEYHTVRIFHNRKDIIEIDGRRMHVLEMEIRYK